MTDALRFLGQHGATVTTGAISNLIGRDRLSVYRCLNRMKKRGQVESTWIAGTHKHQWKLL